MDALMEALGLSDSSSTPACGEKLRDFFLRTADHWVLIAADAIHANDSNQIGGIIQGKELRTAAFKHCQARFLKLKPLLDKLDAMEQEQKMLEAAAAAGAGKRLDAKKKKKKKSKKEKKSKKKKNNNNDDDDDEHYSSHRWRYLC